MSPASPAPEHALGERAESVEDRSNLTRSQFLLWTGQKLRPQEPLYNMAHVTLIRGALDVGVFRLAFQELVRQCDAFRTIVVEEDGVPRQIVRDTVYDLEFVDLSGKHDPEASLQDWVAQRTRRAFHIDERLIDSALLCLGPNGFAWYRNHHHIVMDAWSAGVAYRRMERIYRELQQGVPLSSTVVPSFQDYVTYERQQRAESRWRDLERYWGSRIATEVPSLTFYRSRSTEESGRSIRVPCPLGAERSARLRELIGRPGVRALTPDLALFRVFAALLLAYLHRVSGGRRLRLGTPFHNRSTREFKETVGLFVEIFPLDVELTDDETFLSLVGKIAAETQEVLRHVGPGSSNAEMSGSYEVVLNYVLASFSDFAGFETHNEWVHSGSGDSQHKLRLQVVDYRQSGEFTLYFDCDGQTFDATARRSLVKHYLRVCDALLDSPERRLCDISLMTEDEKALVCRDFNQSRAVYPAERTIPDVFSEQAARSPNEIAVEHGDTQLTYAELEHRADQLADELRRQGVRRGGLVPVCMERSHELIVSLLAILKTGAAYLPIDPVYPPERIRFMREESTAYSDRALPLLTDHRTRERLPGDVGSVLSVDEWQSGAHGCETVEGLREQRPGPEDLAYVIYTSGSTGLPKGAMISHRGLMNYVWWAKRAYLDDAPGDFPLFTSIAFDLTVTSIFVPLVSGGRIVVYESDEAPGLEVLRVVEDDSVDVIKLTPAHLALLRDVELKSSRLRRMILGGEDLKRSLAAEIHEKLGGCVEICNEYGPTETVVGCMLHRFDPAADRDASVPIGKPAANAQIYLLDSRGLPVPPGVVGEICIAGDGVAKGYLRRPELTAARFVEDPFTSHGRMYRSGDLGVWRESGELEFLGRQDDQVKVRGARIELGEVEACLLAHDAITQCVVATVEREAAPRPESLQYCRRCGLASNYPDTSYDQHGVCNMCQTYDTYKGKVADYFRTMDDLRELFEASRATRCGDYDCIMLLSGGKDSTYVLYQLVEMGLRVLAYTLDNGYISDGAIANVRRVVEHVGVGHVFGSTPHMNSIFADSLKRHSNVCNGCFKTIYTLSVNLAREKKIPFIVTGLARGQLFETRLIDMCRAGVFDPDEIDRRVLDARRAYHRMDDAVSELLDVEVFQEESIFDEVQFVDFYRYCDVELDEMLSFLRTRAPWIRPEDTGRSTNCLINDVGIYVHKKERHYHNYALPYSWDVRLGHKTRDAAVDELDDEIDPRQVRRILDEIGYGDPADASELRLAAYYVAPEVELTSAHVREHLAESLPDFMVPAYFVRLEQLPVTSSGKIDRKALPDPTTQEREGAEEYEPPTTHREELLATIWGDVLGVERVGRSDDFFSLGGDSVSSIQIVARAAREGIQIKPRQIFEHPTVAGVAAVASERLVATAEQGLVRGPVPLTPIQAWFLDTRDVDPHLWTQGLWLEVEGGVDREIVEESLRTLALHHDALRLRFLRNEENWTQEIGGDDFELRLNRFEAESCTEEDLEQRLLKIERELAGTLRLDEGLLLRAAWIEMDGGASLLGLVVHHLAIDALSWQTLLDDLTQLCVDATAGRRRRLPPKSTSFKEWAEKFTEHARTPTVAGELDYWKTTRRDVSKFPIDHTAGVADESSTVVVSRSLTVEETDHLLHELPEAVSAEVVELLLTALAESSSRYSGTRDLHVDLEGHGREDVINGVNVVRTIGCFTSMYPVRLEVVSADDPVENLKATKRQYRALPHNGVHYGVLRYLARELDGVDELTTAPQSPVLFNFLGQLKSAFALPDGFSLKVPMHRLLSPRHPRTHLIEVAGYVDEGALFLSWSFSSNRHRPETIEKLAESCLDSLRRLMECSLASESSAMTETDFPLADLDGAGFDKLSGLLDDLDRPR